MLKQKSVAEPESLLVTPHPLVVKVEVFKKPALVHLDNGETFELNPTAEQIWNALKKPCTIESLLKRFSRKYDVDYASLRTDLLLLIGELERRRFLMLDPPAKPARKQSARPPSK